MSDQDIIVGAVRTHANGEIISDLEARVIANAWHGGQSSRFYMLTSTGTIDNSDGQLGVELERARKTAVQSGTPCDWAGLPELGGRSLDALAIDALREYIQDRGTRGPQPNWGDLSW